jgi:hypothetical protein
MLARPLLPSSDEHEEKSWLEKVVNRVSRRSLYQFALAFVAAVFVASMIVSSIVKQASHPARHNSIASLDQ